jgi:hypothetical protein
MLAEAPPVPPFLSWDKPEGDAPSRPIERRQGRGQRKSKAKTSVENGQKLLPTTGGHGHRRGSASYDFGAAYAFTGPVVDTEGTYSST